MNRYRGLRIPPETGEQPISLHHAELDLGLRGDLKARQLPEGASPELWDVRFERGGFRKDFGEKFLGQAAINTILCLIEHKFILGLPDEELEEVFQQFHRLIRFLRDVDGVARTEIWDSTNHQWLLDARADDPLTVIEERYVRGVSVQNVLLFAVAGAPILIREEGALLNAAGDDFPSSVSLTSVGNSSIVTFSSTEVIHRNIFRVNYNIALELLTEGELTVTLEVLVDGTVVGTKTYTISSPTSFTGFTEEHIEFIWGMLPGTDVTLRIESIESTGSGEDSVNMTTEHDESFDDVAATVVAENPLPTVAADDQYTFNWTAASQLSSDRVVTWRVHVWDSTTELWTTPVADFTTLVPALGVTSLEHTVEIPGLSVGDIFAFSEVEDEAVTWTAPIVSWLVGEADFSVDVKPYNKDVDGDPRHGLTYNEVTGTEVTLTPTDGPEALWIEPFADRVVALVDGPNTQRLWWTASGNVKQWDPTIVGAGQIDLFDTRNDPIDDLQCAAPLSSDSLAIFRARSIMRAFRTGQSVQAIGVNHWLENIGTESPFSRQVTPIGIVFLGHDRMVYILTESGIRPVGLPIHQLLIERLTDHLERVDAIFDPVFQHYYLGIPVFGSEKICEIYILDVARLMNEDKIVWRRRSCGDGLERFGLASEL